MTDALLEELPQHKAELYRLFGARQANYFLYPRIEPERKKKIKVNPSLRRHGGRSGANTLWSILRDQSKIKLMRADSKIPAELKEAYGAFVRECLTRHKTVAKRSFYSETEVPESEKIQDSSYNKRVKEMRHKIEFMFRAAQLNEDKTSILLFNNPPPDFNDLEGQEGPFRYHPSWIADEDDEEEADYKKWLKYLPVNWPLVEGEEESNLKSKEVTPRTDQSEAQDQKTRSASRNSNASDDSEDSDDWLINMMTHKPEEEVKEDTPKEKPPPKLVFLTEDMCRQPGQFRERMRTKKDIPVIPPPPQPAPQPQEDMRKQLPPIKPMSAFDKRTSVKPQGMTPRSERSRTAPPGADVPPSRAKASRKTEWQPLTLNALTEYKPAFQAAGDGDFKHGQSDFWKPILS
ncbi:uncharacterized protein [Ptychodera flava]|uniref:uncharacterized protein n=1 Tax=Ptychodera flava TaxID=63121 RepID=UPI00396A8223